MTPSPKAIAIETLEIAESNLLNSFMGVRPDEIHEQAHPEFNSIIWILGHCFTHFHLVLCSKCQETEIFTEDIAHYFRFGTTKEEISKTGPPMTFAKLIDEYLKISASGFSYLQSIDDEDLEKVIFPEYGENLLQSIQRIGLHYMGHVGQIVLIRRALGNPGATFVGGISSIGRSKIREKWDKWWSENRNDFE
ncbi:MAG: hypothetical protein AM326_09885 [Candidatus Thorarchaeota archaeon SMTZ-45]|nr:MAG: hypothetical protein AM326_09885 [Candidatus Thorarchaeota archaeon SMTZ-45]KXH75539.1 MAG: hypothetical protein AM325_11035 [Candidatus Thorarchaeota archaeon SMTZ1-45]